MLTSGRPGPAPSGRLRVQEEYARLQSAKRSTIERRGRIRLQLKSADIPFSELLDAATEKAQRVVADRGEGWRQVQQVLSEVTDATAEVERIESIQKRIQVALAATWRAEDTASAVRRLRLGPATERIAAIHRADDAVQEVGRLSRSLETQLRDVGVLRDGFGAVTFPRIRTESGWLVRRHHAGSAVAAVRRVRGRLEAVGDLEDAASARRERLTAAQDRLVALMRRPS